MAEETNYSRREFLRKIALISAGAVALPALFPRKAYAQTTKTFYVDKNHPNTGDVNDTHGAVSNAPWRTLEWAFGTINGDPSNPDLPSPIYWILEGYESVYLQGSDPNVSVVINVGPGIYNEPFTFGARKNQHIQGIYTVPNFQQIISTPNALVPSEAYTSIETSGLDINLGVPPIDINHRVSIDNCFVYITNPNGRINSVSGGLSIKNCSLLGYQQFLGDGNIVPSLGENQFDEDNVLEDNIITGFDSGASDSPAGKARMRRNLVWKNRNGVHVNGVPNLGDADWGENIFFKNTEKTLICTGGIELILAKGNWWYDAFGALCNKDYEILNTMLGVTDFGSKADGRPISISDFKTEDIFDDGLPVVSGAGLVGLAGLVGAAGAYAIGRKR